ncbi:hypothetical protein ATANTOWER_020199 [Ataeniobius toweri]|uniref:Uncharacterized protein n=1 Tax=Ataeniobius toweri TaxID=208326 RepID=A0ABU7BU87_9TELE|nr:hypothetical protein [Ataeniobius toweri]
MSRFRLNLTPPYSIQQGGRKAESQRATLKTRHEEISTHAQQQLSSIFEVPLEQQQAAGNGDGSHKACEISSHYQYLQPQVYGEWP